MTSQFGAIIVAAGKSKRFLSDDSSSETLCKKPFVRLAGKAVWEYSAELFRARGDVGSIQLVVSPEDLDVVAREFEEELARNRVELVPGGAERYLSVWNALEAMGDDAKYVAVHDAARPCVTERELDAVFAAALKTSAAILAVRATSSFKRARTVDDLETIEAPVSREKLWEAQTPQVFSRDVLVRAYRERPDDSVPTDDAELVSRLGVSVVLAEGLRSNIKITQPEDLSLAAFYLGARR